MVKNGLIGLFPFGTEQEWHIHPRAQSLVDMVDVEKLAFFFNAETRSSFLLLDAGGLLDDLWRPVNEVVQIVSLLFCQLFIIVDTTHAQHMLAH